MLKNTITRESLCDFLTMQLMSYGLDPFQWAVSAKRRDGLLEFCHVQDSELRLLAKIDRGFEIEDVEWVL